MECSCLDIEKMDVKTLKKERHRLLEEIHEKQQTLDQMDYCIYQKKKEEKGEEKTSDSLTVSCKMTPKETAP